MGASFICDLVNRRLAKICPGVKIPGLLILRWDLGLLRALGRFVCVSCVLSLVVLAARGDTTPSSSTQKKTTSHHASKVKKTSRRSRKSRGKPSWKRTQQIIAPDRAQAIQEALVQKHYLHGDPSGVWDNNTQAAMQHFQADHGWQTKMIPDSRALIALGLGPDHQHLLNPESAMTSGPASTESRKSEAPKAEIPAMGSSADPVSTPSDTHAPAVPPDAPATVPSTPSTSAPVTINDQN
jgi:hypothetical protein